MKINPKLLENDNYSTTEEIIGSWLNKPLYRKVLQITPTEQNTTYNHGISNLDKVIKVGGTYKRKNQNQRGDLPMLYTNWQIWIYDFLPTNFRLNISTNQWNAGFEYIYIYIEYTKTSD